MNLDLLAAEAEGYLKGRASVTKENVTIDANDLSPQTNAEILALRKGIIEGRKQGIAIAESRYRNVEWRKLILVVVSGSFVGCGIALALAIWLSTL